MSVNPAILDHQAWLGYLQPDGLVVSPAALVDAQAILDRGQFCGVAGKVRAVCRAHRAEVRRRQATPGHHRSRIASCAASSNGRTTVITTDIPESLKLALAEGETLAPDFAFCEPKPADPARPWLMLIQQLAPGTDFDARTATDARSWNASPAQRFERLLRGVEVPIGLLTNGTQLRLFYAPRGENSGSHHLPRRGDDGDRRPADSRRVPHAAEQQRVCSPGRGTADCRRCSNAAAITRPASPRRSRSKCSTRSTNSSAASSTLTRRRNGAVRRALARDPDDLYAALLTVLMRLVFVLYAEDRDLLPRLRALPPRLLRARTCSSGCAPTPSATPTRSIFATARGRSSASSSGSIHGGCKHPRMAMPARRGYLFDPDRYPFLEGRAATPDRRSTRSFRSSPTACSTACSKSCSSSTASGSPTARSMSSRSAASTRR